MSCQSAPAITHIGDCTLDRMMTMHWKALSNKRVATIP
ncbi:unnamed protein product, partial [Staurois parvus]